MKKQLEAYGIDELPSGWTAEYVEQFSEISTGGRDTKDKVEGGEYPFYVRSQTIERIDTFSFDGVAVLTAGDGVGTGKVFHFVDGKFDFHQRVYRISDFSDHIYPRYFFEFFRRHFIRQVIRYTAKTSVDSVRMEMISRMAIPLPPFSEQVKIGDLLAAFDDEIELLSTKSLFLQEKKRGLTQKLLIGKLRPTGHSSAVED